MWRRQLDRLLVEAGRQRLGLDIIQGMFPHPRWIGRKFAAVLLVALIADVAERVANDLPIAWLNRCGRWWLPIGWMHDRAVPRNGRDACVGVVPPTREPCRA
jgi:hypothetical protein